MNHFNISDIRGLKLFKYLKEFMYLTLSHYFLIVSERINNFQTIAKYSFVVLWIIVNDVVKARDLQKFSM